MEQQFTVRTLIDYFEFSPELILFMQEIGELIVVSDVMDEDAELRLVVAD